MTCLVIFPVSTMLNNSIALIYNAHSDIVVANIASTGHFVLIVDHHVPYCACYVFHCKHNV